MAEFDLLETWRAVHSSALRAPEKLVALALLSHWSRATSAPFPSVARLAALTSFDERTVRRALKSLVDKGAITVTLRWGKSSTYDLAGLRDLPRAESHPGQKVTPGPVPGDPGQRVLLPRAESPTEGTKGRNQGKEAKVPRTKARRPNAAKIVVDPELAGEHKRITEAYFQLFEQANSRKPIFGAREGKSVKLLREKLGSADKAIQHLRGVFADPWWKDKATINTIAADPDKVRASKNASKGNQAKQPNSGWRPGNVV